MAIWSFTARDDLAWNADRIRQGIAAAAAAGAQVLLAPECSLPGYPTAARADLAGIDWCGLAELEDGLLLAAGRAGLVLVLGTAEPDGAGGVANVALAGGAVAPVRYRKRRLTPADQRHFVPGSRAATVDAFGWRLGLAICFDLRFDEVWRDLAGAGCDAFLAIAHLAGPDVDPGVKAQVIPAFCAARAAAWATPLVLANTAAADRWLASGAWDARGVRIADAGDPPADGHLLSATLVRREGFHPWYAGLRAGHLASPAAGQVARP